MTTRRWLKRAIAALMASTLLLILAFHLLYKPSSMFSRYQREGAKQLPDHAEPPIEALKNCSCYMNYIRHHAHHAWLNASETSTGLLNVTLETAATAELETNGTDDNKLSGAMKSYVLESVPVPKGQKPAPNYLSEPIDRHLFSYIHNPEKACFLLNGTQAPVYLLFYVPTSPDNFLRRNLIRKSFGNEKTWPVIDGAKTKTLFMIGKTDKRNIQLAIDDEARNFGDIVQETFVDSYLNLTRKTIMGLKWVTNHCRHARYVMKIDDDTTVNQHRILQIVRDVPRANFCIGFLFKNPVVDRNRKSKFYMSAEYYNNTVFPPYVNGMGYIMSADLVDALYHVAVTLPLFPWEDVFVGMCLHKLNVTPSHDENFIYWGPARHILGPSGYQLVSKHAILTNLRPDYVWQIYNHLIRHQV